jgi:hypothetical protein
LASAAVYLLCLTQDGFYVYGHDPEPAFGLLLWGWMGILGPGHFSWLANIFLFMSWRYCFRRQYRFAGLFGGLAVAFALSFLTNTRVPVSEAPTFAEVESYGIGYWLWIVSMLVLTLGAGVLIRTAPHNPSM